MVRFVLTSICLLLLSPSPLSAEIYRWTDADGNLHFTQDLNQVPEGQRSQARNPSTDAPSRLQRYSPPARIQSERPGRSGDVLRIPFERQGTTMRVNALVNGRQTVPFLVDTGASGVSLPGSVVKQLGISIRPDTPRVTVSTANGTVRFPVVQLASVQLGGARVEKLEATVNPTMSVGLLGGTFFNNFKYSVDTAAGVITLIPNDGVRAGEAADQWRQRFLVLRRSIARLETHLGGREISRMNRQNELETNLAQLKRELSELEIEANHARVPKSWRE